MRNSSILIVMLVTNIGRFLSQLGCWFHLIFRSRCSTFSENCLPTWHTIRDRKVRSCTVLQASALNRRPWPSNTDSNDSSTRDLERGNRPSFFRELPFPSKATHSSRRWSKVRTVDNFWPLLSLFCKADSTWGTICVKGKRRRGGRWLE